MNNARSDVLLFVATAAAAMISPGCHTASRTSPPPRKFTLPAKPHRLSIDPRTAALNIVDMQNDFGSIGGNLPRTNHDASLIVVQTLLGSVSTPDALINAIEGTRR